MSKDCVITRGMRCNSAQVGMHEKRAYNRQTKCSSKHGLHCHDSVTQAHSVVRSSLKCSTTFSMPSTTQGVQGRWLLQHVTELEKHLDGDDNGGFFFNMWVLAVSVTGYEVVEEPGTCIPTSILLEKFSISIFWNIMASP